MKPKEEISKLWVDIWLQVVYIFNKRVKKRLLIVLHFKSSKK